MHAHLAGDVGRITCLFSSSTRNMALLSASLMTPSCSMFPVLPYRSFLCSVRSCSVPIRVPLAFNASSMKLNVEGPPRPPGRTTTVCSEMRAREAVLRHDRPAVVQLAHFLRPMSIMGSMAHHQAVAEFSHHAPPPVVGHLGAPCSLRPTPCPTSSRTTL